MGAIVAASCGPQSDEGPERSQAPAHTGSNSIDFSAGFTASGLQLNGNAVLSGTRLRLTTGSSEAASAFFTTPVNVQAFTTDFSFQLTNANADGFTFTVQNTSPAALGPGGGGLGYGPDSPSGQLGIGKSVAVKFDLYNNAGEGTNSTGLYINGASPTEPSVNLSGVNLHSGDVLNVHIAYDGRNLWMAVYDASGATAEVTFPVDIPGTVGSTTAYVGFTAGTGGLTATQDILSWTYAVYSLGSLNFGNGFTGTGLQFNGSAVLSGTRLRLTNGGIAEAASAFFPIPVDVHAFTTDFSFQLTNANADGFTFTLQNVGPTALGPGGGGLGYGPDSPSGQLGIGKSVAVKFDLYNNAGEGTNSTGLYINGASPSVPSVNLSGVNLHSGDIFNVHITYDGTNLAMTVADASTGATASVSFPVDIPGTVGSTTAYAGFTAGTGGLTATQDILSWTYGSASINFRNGFTGTGFQLNGSAAFGGSTLRLTSGGIAEAASAFFTTPVNVQSFTTNFRFQLTNASADGFTFTLQNVGPTALGPGGGGLGYGPDSPSGAPGIGNSVAVKFDLYNNAGEGTNSTGLYTNGASPTVPAVNLSGVNLHSGDVLNAHITYDGTNVAMIIAAASTGATASVTFPIDIPGTIGSTTAYAGFTAGTGGLVATQDILSWTFSPGASLTTYTVGGTITGLSDTIVLQVNGGDDLTLSANGSFTFATPLADGSGYSVTVAEQPDNVLCGVAATGTGIIAGHNVTNVAVSCQPTPSGAHQGYCIADAPSESLTGECMDLDLGACAIGAAPYYCTAGGGANGLFFGTSCGPFGEIVVDSTLCQF